ncbi:MAG: hypothetical protein ABI158_09375, partial [Edaphobacter sp.]
MKRIILSLFLALTCVSAHAATWYIRTDGGTSAQCNGHTNAALAGATGANCALSNPFYLVTDNTTGAAFSWTFSGLGGAVAGGDTIQFEDVGPYYMGETLNGLGTHWIACGTDGSD